MSETYWTPERQKRQDEIIEKMNNGEIKTHRYPFDEYMKKLD